MPPTNDRISGALAISTDGSDTIDLSTATGMESDEASWWAVTQAYSVWYVWQPTVKSYLYLSTSWATSAITVWSDLAAPDDNLTTLQATSADGGPIDHLAATYPEKDSAEGAGLRVDGEAGHTYLIYLYDWNVSTPPASEPVTLSWTIKPYNPGPWQADGSSFTESISVDHAVWMNQAYDTGSGAESAAENPAAMGTAAWSPSSSVSSESGIELGDSASGGAKAVSVVHVPSAYSTGGTGSDAVFSIPYTSLRIPALPPGTPVGVDTTRPWEWDTSTPYTVTDFHITGQWTNPGQQDADVRRVPAADYTGPGQMNVTATGTAYFDDQTVTYYGQTGGTWGTGKHAVGLIPRWFTSAQFAALPTVATIPGNSTAAVSIAATGLIDVPSGHGRDGERALPLLWMPSGNYPPTSTNVEYDSASYLSATMDGVKPSWRYLDADPAPDLDLGQFIAIAHPVADAHVRVTDLGGL